MDRPLDLTAPSVDGEPADRMRVLLVEDDDGDALIVEEELELSGARVDVERRRTLGEATAAGLQRFDCVLLDLNLPDAQGLQGLHELRARAPDLAVLVLTGLDDERRGIEAVGAGAQDYLIKGSTTGVLLARSLRYAVERRRAELTQQQLSIAQLEARENARLERGLLPEPLVSDPTLVLASHYKPGRRRALLGGDFFDAVQTPGGAVAPRGGGGRRPRPPPAGAAAARGSPAAAAAARGGRRRARAGPAGPAARGARPRRMAGLRGGAAGR